MEINQYRAIYHHFPASLNICQTIYFRVWTVQPKSFSKELSLHPKQIMNNAQIDTASFIQFTGPTGVWCAARLVFHSLCSSLGEKLQQKAPQSLNDAHAACLARGRVYIFMESSEASLHPAGAIDSHRSPKDKQTHLSRLV